MKIIEKVIVRERLGMKARHGNTGRPFYETVSGADLSRKTGKWMELERIIDRENDRYEEIVRDPETDEIIYYCEEPLSEHWGHGTAKKKSSY